MAIRRAVRMTSPTDITVLILEDHPEDVELIVERLRQDGYRPKCRVACNETEFIASLGTKPDLILSDYQLPQFDGLRALRIVRNRGLDVPFIMVSGSMRDEAVAECLQQGATDYLLKDRLSRLGSAVNQALEAKRLREEHGRAALEKARSEAALQVVEDKYRSIFEHATEGLFQTTPEGRYLSANPAMARILGYSSPDELILKRLDIARQGYANPADRERFIRLVTEQGTVNGFEYEALRQDGSRVWVSENARAVRDETGRVRFFEGSIIDITKRRQAEESLRESERRFRNMMGKIELLSLMLDRDARITYCNDYFLRLTGWQRDEVIGQDWFQTFLPFESFAELRVIFSELLKDTPSTWHFEKEILTRSGDRRMIRWNNSVLRSATGETIGTASIGEDVTESRRAQSQLQLRTSELELVLDSVPAMVFVKDLQHRLVRVNKEVARFFGGNKSQFEGKSDADLGSPYAAQYERDENDVVMTGRPKTGIIEPVLLPAGVRWLQTDKLPYRDAKGKIVGVIGFSLDITERKKLEEVFQHRAAELERFRQMSIGRELQMIELKKEVNALAQECGKPPRYDLSFLEEPPKPNPGS